MVQVRKFLVLKLTENPLLREAREGDRLHRGPEVLVGSAFSKGTAVAAKEHVLKHVSQCKYIFFFVRCKCKKNTQN